MVRKANPKSKDCYASICQALKRKGESCDEHDIRGLTDSKDSCEKNKQRVLNHAKLASSNQSDRYAGQYEDFKQSYGKSKVKKPCTPPVKVKAHCRKECTIKVKAFTRSCPTIKHR